MAIDTFKFCTQVQSGGGAMTQEDNVRAVSFGGGYTQTGSAGFNVRRRTFQVIYAANDWEDMKKFCDEHLLKPFIWQCPDGDLALFVVKPGSIATKVISRRVREVSAQFVEQFTSIK